MASVTRLIERKYQRTASSKKTYATTQQAVGANQISTEFVRCGRSFNGVLDLNQTLPRCAVDPIKIGPALVGKEEI